jgi:hypothetical protein
MLDGDPAGQQRPATIINLLAPQIPITAVSLQA